MPWVQYVGKRSLAGDVLGANLISNGHFTDGTAGWTGSNATLSKTADGKLRVANSSATTGRAYTTITTEAGALYRIDTDYYLGTSVNSTLYVGTDTAFANAFASQVGSADSALSFYFVASGTSATVVLVNGSVTSGHYADVDNVKVRKVEVRGHATDIEHVTNGAFSVDNQWTKGTGWTIAGGVAAGASGTASNLEQLSAITLRHGKVYDTSFQVVSASGSVVRWSGALSGTDRSTVATFTEQLTADLTSASVGLVKASGFVGSVDNLSIKLAADNTWTLDFDISSFQPGRDPNVEQVQMMDRSTDTQYYASKNLISVTTDILAYGEWQFMEEFIDNAIDGQTVIFDPYGTESQPKAPGSYILLPGAGLTRIVGADTTERRQYQLQFRQA